jgi:hypothetical protein
MWAENACVTGAGSYDWSYDAGNGFLRLGSYGVSSTSAVWSSSVSLPSAPVDPQAGVLYAYLNQGLATGGLDNIYFSFLRESGCTTYPLTQFIGKGCDYATPELKQYSLPSAAPIWGTTRLLGVNHTGLTGCGTSNFYIDWVGIWIKPS